MIREIACDIAAIVRSSGYVNEHFEYCELIKRDGVTYPAQYIGGGNYEQVLNHDVNGTSYLRRNGKVSYSGVSGSDNIRLQACGGVQFVTMKLPLRLVMVVPKVNLHDDAFSDDALVGEMIALLSGSVPVSIFGVRDLTYNIVGSDIDALSIWKEEVKGVEYQMRFDYSYIAIDFNASAVINPSCLIQDCY